MENRLIGNRGAAIHLWASAEKARENFPSTGNDIVGNTISNSAAAYNLTGSGDTLLKNNTITNAKEPGSPAPDRGPANALAASRAR